MNDNFGCKGAMAEKIGYRFGLLKEFWDLT
jgi:hypothetical protein